MDKLPVYKLVIDDSKEESGVSAIAFVTQPAVMLDWHAFSEQDKQQFKVVSEEKRLVSGAAMVADLPIYRRSPSGDEYYVIFDATTIEQIRNKFSRLNLFNSTNEQHTNITMSGVYMVESYLVDESRGVKAPNGYPNITNGSWITTYKIDNEDVWNRVKEGEFRGFSIEGYFDQVLLDEKPMSELDKIAEDIVKLCEQIVQKINK